MTDINEYLTRRQYLKAKLLTLELAKKIGLLRSLQLFMRFVLHPFEAEAIYKYGSPGIRICFSLLFFFLLLQKPVKIATLKLFISRWHLYYRILVIKIVIFFSQKTIKIFWYFVIHSKQKGIILFLLQNLLEHYMTEINKQTSSLNQG